MIVYHRVKSAYAFVVLALLIPHLDLTGGCTG